MKLKEEITGSANENVTSAIVELSYAELLCISYQDYEDESSFPEHMIREAKSIINKIDSQFVLAVTR